MGIRERRAATRYAPCQDDAIVFRNIFVSADMFVSVISRVVIVWDHGKRPSGEDVFTRA